MTTPDFSLSFLVDQSPEEVFAAVNNVRGWWSETLEGGTHKLDDEFIYRHKNMHVSTQRLTAVVPNERVQWLVTDSALSFIENKGEWTGTQVCFEIARQGSQTQLCFIHQGLQPGLECFEACSGGWNYYIKESLLPLITTGQGRPDKKEETQS